MSLWSGLEFGLALLVIVGLPRNPRVRETLLIVLFGSFAVHFSYTAWMDASRDWLRWLSAGFFGVYFAFLVAARLAEGRQMPVWFNALMAYEGPTGWREHVMYLVLLILLAFLRARFPPTEH